MYLKTNVDSKFSPTNHFRIDPIIDDKCYQKHSQTKYTQQSKTPKYVLGNVETKGAVACPRSSASTSNRDKKR